MSNVKEAYNVVFVEAQDPLRPTSTRLVFNRIVMLPEMIHQYTLAKKVPIIANGHSLSHIKDRYK